MADETVRVGMIGAGFIASYHLGGLRAAGGAAVPVICDRIASNAEVLAQRFHVAEVVQDYRLVLDRSDIDAVVIATPDDTHEEIAAAAAETGKAILLQKPMAMSSVGCRRIIDAARQHGVNLQVAWMHRHFEEVVFTQELLAGGKLGEVYAVRMRNAVPGMDERWYFTKGQVAGGVVMQLGVHGIDLTRYLLGDIETVHATSALKRRMRRFANGSTIHAELEDHAFATYRYAGGMLGTHEMSFSEVQGTDRFRLEIYCADATVLLRTHRGKLTLWSPRVTGEPGWFVPRLPGRAFGERHHAWWLDIVRGKRHSEPTAEDGLAVMLVAETIYQSARSGCVETVPRAEAGVKE